MRALFLVLGLLASGCVTYSQGASLGPATPAAASTGRGVWLEAARVTDPEFRDARGNATLALTLALKRYLEETKSFGAVRSLPGEPGADDQWLAFEFTELRLRRQPHPLLVVASMTAVAAPLYLFVNGPMNVTDTAVTGVLTVRGPSGEFVTRFTARSESSNTERAWDGVWHYGVLDRSVVVKTLVDRYVRFLSAPPLAP